MNLKKLIQNKEENIKMQLEKQKKKDLNQKKN